MNSESLSKLFAKETAVSPVVARHKKDNFLIVTELFFEWQHTCYTYARLSRLICLIIITGMSGFNSSTCSGISGIRTLFWL